MKKNNWKILIYLMIVFCFLYGCSNAPADIEGYVLDIDQNSRLLVVTGAKKEDVLKISTIDRETRELFKDAYWVSGNNIKNFKQGDFVEVWFRGDIATSFPAQVSAKKIRKTEKIQE